MDLCFQVFEGKQCHLKAKIAIGGDRMHGGEVGAISFPTDYH